MEVVPAAFGHNDKSARQLLLVVVLVCVLCAQALGLMHGIVHTFHHDPQESHASSAHDGDHGSAAAAEPVHWFDALFVNHDQAGDCRLFDALGQHLGPVPFAPELSLVLAPCVRHQRLLTRAFVARWAAFFDARGPPLSH